MPEAQFPRTGYAENPRAYAPALLLQDSAYSYRVWKTLITLPYALLRYLKSDSDIHQGERLCGRLLPSVLLVSEKNPSQHLSE
jgi:hypothetical protein